MLAVATFRAPAREFPPLHENQGSRALSRAKPSRGSFSSLEPLRRDEANQLLVPADGPTVHEDHRNGLAAVGGLDQLGARFRVAGDVDLLERNALLFQQGLGQTAEPTIGRHD